MFSNFLIPVYEGAIGKLNRKKLTEIKNQEAFRVVFNNMVNMALDFRYSFDGLPDTMDERVLKQSLFVYGCAGLFTYNGVPMCLPIAPDGSALDIYGNPRGGYIFSKNGKLNKNIRVHYKYDDPNVDKFNLGDVITKEDDYENGVILFENKLRSPFLWNTIYYANSVSDCLRTLDSVRRFLKVPFVVKCEEQERTSIEESLRAFENNEDIIASIHAHNIDKTDIFDVQMSPNQAGAVTQLVDWYNSQYRVLCGIDANESVDKKGENLISLELNVNNEYVRNEKFYVLEELNNSLEIFNKLAGTNITAVETRAYEEESGDFTDDSDSGISMRGREDDGIKGTEDENIQGDAGGQSKPV